MRVLGIDPGIINLGMVLVEADDRMKLTQVLQCARVDLTQLPSHHKRVPRKDCRLHHSCMHCDWIDHLLQEYSDWFESAATVVIEQQPPGGHTSIEQLLAKACREKVVLVSPRSVHAFFGISDLDYDARKESMVERTAVLLEGVLDDTDDSARKHDMADALGLVIFYLHRAHRQYLLKQRVQWLERCTVKGHSVPTPDSDFSNRLQVYRRGFISEREETHDRG